MPESLDLDVINRVFARQLGDKKTVLTENYFNLTDADRHRPSVIDGLRPMTDEDWERYKQRRLVSDLGTRKQVGDVVLYAIFYEYRVAEGVPEVVQYIRTIVERDFATLIRDYRHVPSPLVDGNQRILPSFVKSIDTDTMMAKARALMMS